MENQSDELREQLAAVQHDSWAHWMKYLFSRCGSFRIVLESGAVHEELPVILREQVDRWRCQMETPYADLTEEEKESDREQVDKVLALIEPLLEENKRSNQNLQNACDEYEIRLGADPEGYSQEAQEQARIAILKEGATCVSEAREWVRGPLKVPLIDWVQQQALKTPCKHCKKLPIKNSAKNYVTHHGRGDCLGVVRCTEWLEVNRGELDLGSARQKEKEEAALQTKSGTEGMAND